MKNATKHLCLSSPTAAPTTTRWIAVAVLLCMVTIGCSRSKEPAVDTSSIEQLTLLGSLPAETLAFLYTTNVGSAADRWRASPAAGMSRKLTELSLSQAADLAPQFPGVLEGLEQAGLWGPLAAESLSETVSFAALDSATDAAGVVTARPIAGVFMRGLPAVDLRQKISSLEKVATAQGLSTTRASLGDTEQLTITIPASARGGGASPFGDTITVIANRGALTLGSTAATAQRGLQTDGAFYKSNSAAELRTKLAGKFSDLLSLAYVDVASLNAQKELTAVASSQIQKATNQQATELPVQNLIGTTSMRGDRPTAGLLVALTAAGRETPWAKRLRSLTGNELLDSDPANDVLSIGVSGPLLSTLAGAALGADLPGTPTAATLEGVTRASLLLAAPLGSSPFPDLGVLVHGPAASQVQSQITELAKASTGPNSGLPIAPWQRKNIAGAEVDFTSSPLGVGAYITGTKERVVATSSERLMQALLSAPSSSGAATINKESASLIEARLDFVTLASALKDLEGTLAMFTGGQSSQLSKTAALIAPLASGSASLQFDGGSFSGEAQLVVAAPK